MGKYILCNECILNNKKSPFIMLLTTRKAALFSHQTSQYNQLCDKEDSLQHHNITYQE